MFTSCGTGCLHLFPAQEPYRQEELYKLMEDAGPWGHTPSQDCPVTLQQLLDYKQQVASLWE